MMGADIKKAQIKKGEDSPLLIRVFVEHGLKIDSSNEILIFHSWNQFNICLTL